MTVCGIEERAFSWAGFRAVNTKKELSMFEKAFTEYRKNYREKLPLYWQHDGPRLWLNI